MIRGGKSLKSNVVPWQLFGLAPSTSGVCCYTATLFRLHIIYDCVHFTEAAVSGCDREGVGWHFLLGPLQESWQTSYLNYCQKHFVAIKCSDSIVWGMWACKIQVTNQNFFSFPRTTSYSWWHTKRLWTHNRNPLASAVACSPPQMPSHKRWKGRGRKRATLLS